MTTPSDQERWAAVVAARSELHHVQADFHQNAADALRGNVGGLLRDLVQRALADADPEVREAGRFYADEYAVSLRTT